MAVSQFYHAILVVGIVLGVLPHSNTGLLSDYKICGDSECERPMSRVQAIRDHHGKDCRYLNFRRGGTIFVYHKLTGKRDDLWAGTIDKQFGYFPKDAVQEELLYATVENVVATQESDFFCVDEFGHLVDSSHLDNDANGDDAVKNQKQERTQTTPYLYDNNAESPSTTEDISAESVGSAQESESSINEEEEGNTNADDAAAGTHKEASMEQGGSASSSWLGSSVTGWIGLTKEEEPANLVEAQKEEAEEETLEASSFTSSMTGWLGFGGGGKTDDEEVRSGQEDAEISESYTSTMTGWLGFGGEKKTENSAEKKEERNRDEEQEQAETFRSRRMSLNLEGSQLHEEEEEEKEAGAFDWLGNRLTSTLGFGQTNQDSETTSGQAEEAAKEEEQASGSWYDMGFGDMLGFRTDKGDESTGADPQGTQMDENLDQNLESEKVDTSQSQPSVTEEMTEVREGLKDDNLTSETDEAERKSNLDDDSNKDGVSSDDAASEAVGGMPSMPDNLTQIESPEKEEDDVVDDDEKEKSALDGERAKEMDGGHHQIAQTIKYNDDDDDDDGRQTREEDFKTAQETDQGILTQSDTGPLSEFVLKSDATGQSAGEVKEDIRENLLGDSAEIQGQTNESADKSHEKSARGDSGEFGVNKEETKTEGAKEEVPVSNNNETSTQEEGPTDQEQEKSIFDKSDLNSEAEIAEEEASKEEEERRELGEVKEEEEVVKPQGKQQEVDEEKKDEEEIKQQEVDEEKKDEEEVKQQEVDEEKKDEEEIKKQEVDEEKKDEEEVKQQEVDEEKKDEEEVKQQEVDEEKKDEEEVKQKEVDEEKKDEEEVKQQEVDEEKKGEEEIKQQEVDEEKKDEEEVKQKEVDEEKKDEEEVKQQEVDEEKKGEEEIKQQEVDEEKKGEEEIKQQEVEEITEKENPVELKEKIQREVEDIEENQREVGGSKDEENYGREEAKEEEKQVDLEEENQIREEKQRVDEETKDEEEQLNELGKQQEVGEIAEREKQMELEELKEEKIQKEVEEIEGNQEDLGESKEKEKHREEEERDEVEEEQLLEELQANIKGAVEELKVMEQTKDFEKSEKEGEKERRESKEEPKFEPNTENNNNKASESEEEEVNDDKSSDASTLSEERQRENPLMEGVEIQEEKKQTEHTNEVKDAVERVGRERREQEEEECKGECINAIDGKDSPDAGAENTDPVAEITEGTQTISEGEEEERNHDAENRKAEDVNSNSIDIISDLNALGLDQIEDINELPQFVEDIQDDLSGEASPDQTAEVGENKQLDSTELKITELRGGETLHRESETNDDETSSKGKTEQTHADNNAGEREVTVKHHEEKEDKDADVKVAEGFQSAGTEMNEEEKILASEVFESQAEVSEQTVQQHSTGSPLPPDDPENRNAESGGTFGIFRNAFGFFKQIPAPETKEPAQSLDSNTLEIPESHTSLTPGQAPDTSQVYSQDLHTDTPVTVSEKPPSPTQTSHIYSSDIPLNNQSKTLSKHYKNLLTYMSADDTGVLLELFGRHKLQFLDDISGSTETMTGDPDTDESILLDIERLLHHHREILIAPSMKMQDVQQEDKEKTRALIALQKLEMLLDKVRETFSTGKPDTSNTEDQDGSSCVEGSCSTSNKKTSAEEESHDIILDSHTLENEQVVLDKEEDKQICAGWASEDEEEREPQELKGIIQHMINNVHKIAEDSSTHVHAARELLIWLTIQPQADKVLHPCKIFGASLDPKLGTNVFDYFFHQVNLYRIRQLMHP